MFKSNAAQVLEYAGEGPVASDISDDDGIPIADVRACFDCPFYDQDGPHGRTGDHRLTIRCKKFRQLGNKGLTAVVDTLSDCAIRDQVVYLNRRT